MIQLFQIYKKHARIRKPYYTSELRNEFLKWDKSIVSKVGYVKNDKLYLSDDNKNLLNLNRTGTIILQDIIGYSNSTFRQKIKNEAKEFKFPSWYSENIVKSTAEQNPELICFTPEIHSCFFEIFSIEKSDSELFELFLRYKANELKIGEPKREDHKLCHLIKGLPVRICINGKSDSTMSSGSQRTYEEFEYIIEYLGEIKSIEYQALNKIEVEKEIPQRLEKTIDLRKILY